jgi:Ca-activated chloride channel family protein
VDVSEEHETTTDGIDIVMAMDISGSMLARDFTPDRLTSAKHLAAEFVANRRGDRLAVVAFAGEAFTQAPLTSDQATVATMLSRLRSGVVDDGTAIGNGLATAINRLRESSAKSKVIILLTDGVNNRGEISPQMAAEIAKTYGIRVYTIGVGANGMAPYPVMTPWGVEVQNVKVEIDEALLSEIADATGGRYFRATDNTKLAEIYSEINKMEKARTTIDSFPVYKELFGKYALLALMAILLELVLKWFVIRRLP